MIRFYTLFHLNLMYSSIEENEREVVIDRCYYPLLKIAEKGFHISIELSGLTLEIIQKIKPQWVEEFKRLLKEEKVELIGSGYSQIIGPLLPYELNLQNQLIGLDVYENILGVKPKIALVNEMAYSKGLVDVYKEAGYEAIVMEWNNPYRFHKEWNKNWVYYPQIAKGIESNIPVIWADSIAFQKFQRYAHGEMPLKEYFYYLKSHDSEEIRFFPLYANDVEIFNFRPGRYETEANLKFDEWRRIKKLLGVLKNKGFEFAFLKDTLKFKQNNTLNLESSQQPIPVKKQEKYNINRWALTGRGDLEINTKIFRLLKTFERNKPSKEDWKKLLCLASSDFRTHITQTRWDAFKDEFDGFVKKWNAKPVYFSYSTGKEVKFNIKENLFSLTIETEKLKCVFNKKKGCTARAVIFKKKSQNPLIGTLPHGYYDDISLGADFFSFHSIIEKPGEHKFTNLYETECNLIANDYKVKIESRCLDRDAEFLKIYEIFEDALKIYIKITLPKRDFAIIHPLNITFNPEAFDKNTLFFETHNGFKLPERFELKNQPVAHSQSLSVLISAKHGLGATEGLVVIGDKDKNLTFMHNQTLSALIPSIFFLPIDNTYFFRLQYSAQEMDETFKPNDTEQVIECEFLIR